MRVNALADNYYRLPEALYSECEKVVKIVHRSNLKIDDVIIFECPRNLSPMDAGLMKGTVARQLNKLGIVNPVLLLASGMSLRVMTAEELKNCMIEGIMEGEDVQLPKISEFAEEYRDANILIGMEGEKIPQSGVDALKKIITEAESKPKILKP